MFAIAFTVFHLARYAAARPVFAIRALTVQGAEGKPLAHVTAQQVAQIGLPHLRGTFFTASLDEARAGFEAVPWVRKASVRRQWPNRLVVTIEEHRALARWNDEAGNRFVNVFGEAFNAPGEVKLGATLPLLTGPEGSEKEVAQRYSDIAALFAKIDKSPQLVALSPRQAWTVRLSDGLAIEVGREQPQSSTAARLQRFVSNYAATVGRVGARAEAVDLRYPNGFAAKINGLRAGAAPALKPKKPAAPARKPA